MPQLEQGDLAAVAGSAHKVAAALLPWIDNGYDIVALVPSCALMLKFEWPLILPEDAAVEKLAAATFDVSEYIVGIARKEGLAAGLSPIEGGVTVQIACHARAQNMGQKAAEMLRLLPDTKVSVIERCSGHGGSWGVLRENFTTAVKIGKPVARQALKNAARFVSSECPLAGMHIVQGMQIEAGAETPLPRQLHPIELVARAYGIPGAWSDDDMRNR
jgi:glycerol-3-phosphate dehydrogenase subunit C